MTFNNQVLIVKQLRGNTELLGLLLSNVNMEESEVTGRFIESLLYYEKQLRIQTKKMLKLGKEE